MPQNYKALIIGTSLTGKTTLLKYLREKTDLNVQEMDEALLQLNDGKWPNDDTYKNTVLSPQIKAKVLLNQNIVFFTNAHYFTHSDLQAARRKGFKIVQLFVNKEEMKKRNKNRMIQEGYEDHSRWFDAMLRYQKDIKDNGFVDTVIESNKPVAAVAEELLTLLQQI